MFFVLNVLGISSFLLKQRSYATLNVGKIISNLLDDFRNGISAMKFSIDFF